MNVENYLTLPEASLALGANGRRAIYRAIERAEAAGEGEMTVKVLGKRVVPKANLKTLKRYYYPYYSPQHQSMVKLWGAQGGSASAETKRKRKARAAKSQAAS